MQATLIVHGGHGEFKPSNVAVSEITDFENA
jgi:hypothetical protein